MHSRDLGVQAFESPLFEARMAYSVKMNGDFARTGKLARLKRGVGAYRV